MRLTWLGTAGLKIEHDDATLLIDPYISRPGKLQLAFSRLIPDQQRIERFAAGLNNPLGILVGHTHMDHALDVPDLLKRLDCPALGGASLANLIAASGLEPARARRLAAGQNVQLGPFQVRALASRHGRVVLGRVPFPGEIDSNLSLPAKVADYKHGEVWSFLVSAGGLTLYHQGSADAIEQTLDGLSADVLFCCVPGWRRRPELPRILVERLRPRAVAPFHFDDFSGFKIDAPIAYEDVPRLPGNDPEALLRAFKLVAPQIAEQRLGIGMPWLAEV